jgi:perosamine synthetase
MKTRKIVFAKPYFSEDDLNEITQGMRGVLQSGWLTSGPNVQKFEDAFAKYIGTSYAVAVNSCTAALQAILLAMGVKSGDEVIVPSDTFVATANAALYVGAKPVFADSDPLTFNISPIDIENKITERTKVISAVHLGGNPCDMAEIRSIAESHKIKVIEDSAHAHGSKYGFENCGSMSTAGAFSFYATKVITTAEGGMVTTNDKDLAQKVKILRNSGRAGYGPLDISELGYNFRMSELHGVVGLNQFKHLDDYIKQRNLMASYYNELLSEVDWLKPQLVRKNNYSSYYAYIVKMTRSSPFSRDDLIEKLKKYEVMTSVLYYPAHLQTYYRNWFNGNPPKLPVAEDLGKTSFALPMHNGMSMEDVEYIADVLKSLA